MTALGDLSVQATEGSAVGKQIFDREGVLVVKGLFPAAVVEPAVALLSESLAQVDALCREYGFSMEDEDASTRVTALVDRQSNVIPEKHMHIFQGHYPLEVRLSETLREFPRFANNHPLLFELLGTRRLFAHMPPTARYVLPRCSLAAVPPHQDISYNRHMDEFCVVWVPLVPIDEQCGGMAAYLRTNHVGEVLTGEVLPGANGWLRPIESADLERAERVVLTPLEVGDTVILGHRTIHESMPNRSNRVRMSCDFRFFGERSHSTKHYLDLASDTVVAPATPGG